MHAKQLSAYNVVQPIQGCPRIRKNIQKIRKYSHYTVNVFKNNNKIWKVVINSYCCDYILGQQKSFSPLF